MGEIKSLRTIITNPQVTENTQTPSNTEVTFFDNPQPVEKGRIGVAGTICRQTILAGLIIGVYLLMKIFFPNLFTATNNYLTLNIGHSQKGAAIYNTDTGVESDINSSGANPLIDD